MRRVGVGANKTVNLKAENQRLLEENEKLKAENAKLLEEKKATKKSKKQDEVAESAEN